MASPFLIIKFMEHSHDIVKVEVLDSYTEAEFTKFTRRDGNTFILRNIPKEFFDNRKVIKNEECLKQTTNNH